MNNMVEDEYAATDRINNSEDNFIITNLEYLLTCINIGFNAAHALHIEIDKL